VVGKLLPQPAIVFPAPFVSRYEGGLLGLALDPQFAQNGFIYVYQSYDETNKAPDGSIYFMTNNRDGRGSLKGNDDKLIRLKPNF
jgi:glucose/arabinose dehydrogenase